MRSWIQRRIGLGRTFNLKHIKLRPRAIGRGFFIANSTGADNAQCVRAGILSFNYWFVLSVAFCASNVLGAEPLRDLPKALKAAKAQGKPVFVYVYDSI